MSGVNHVIYGCSSATIHELNTGEKNIVAVITQDRVIDDNLKRQIKN